LEGDHVEPSVPTSLSFVRLISSVVRTVPTYLVWDAGNDNNNQSQCDPCVA